MAYFICQAIAIFISFEAFRYPKQVNGISRILAWNCM